MHDDHMLCYAMLFMTISMQYTWIIWRASHMMDASNSSSTHDEWLANQLDWRIWRSWPPFEIPHRSLHVIPSLKDDRRKNLLALPPTSTKVTAPNFVTYLVRNWELCHRWFTLFSKSFILLWMVFMFLIWILHGLIVRTFHKHRHCHEICETVFL